MADSACSGSGRPQPKGDDATGTAGTRAVPATAEAVEASTGRSSWSVSVAGWVAHPASLPDECVALLAPPIVVCAAALSPVAPDRRVVVRSRPDRGGSDQPDGPYPETDGQVFVPAPPRAPGRHRPARGWEPSGTGPTAAWPVG